MRKFLFLACIVFLFANIAVSQTTNKKNTSQTKTASSASTNASSAAKSPSLSTKDPSFAGFTGSFIKFGRTANNGRPFTMQVEYKPWFIEIKGVADASHNTEDLDVLIKDIVAVLAYYNSPGKAADGTDYQAGIFDFMMYLDDDPINISNLSFTLLDKAASGSAILTQAKTWNFEQGKVFKTQKYSNDVIKAQASAIDKADIMREQSAAKKRVSDSIAKEKKRSFDSINKAKKRARDSIAEANEAKAQAKKKAAQKKRRAVVEEDEDDEDEPPVKKKKSVSAKKKRPVVEDDDDDEDEPPVKKKKSASAKKKRPVVEDDDDD